LLKINFIGKLHATAVLYYFNYSRNLYGFGYNTFLSKDEFQYSSLVQNG